MDGPAGPPRLSSTIMPGVEAPRMRWKKRSAILFFGTGLLCGAAGDSFSLNLQIQGVGKAQQVRGVQNTDALPTMVAKQGDILSVRWSIANNGTAPVPDLTLHFVLDRDSPDLRRRPLKATNSAVYESALLMDFDSGRSGSGDLLLQAPEPGNYIAAFETLGAAKKLGHEYSAAINLKVESQ